jgi:hypothetical protein
MDLPVDAFLTHYHLTPSTPETINPILDAIDAHNDEKALDLIAQLYPQLSEYNRINLLYFLTDLLNPLYTYDYILIEGNVYRTDTQRIPNPTQSAWQRLAITPTQNWWGVMVQEIDTTPEFLTYYNQRLQETELYRCGVDGTCQRDFAGVSLQECQDTCETKPMIPDLYYDVLSYDPGSALELPLKDQVRVVRDIVGYTIPITKVHLALRALASGEWKQLRLVDELQPYLKVKYGAVEYALKEIASRLNFNIRAIDFNALKTPFTEAVRAFHATGDRGLFRYTVLGLFYDDLELEPTVDDDELEYNIEDDARMANERNSLFIMGVFIDGSGRELIDAIV